MAQNTNGTSIGCATGIVRVLGILLLLAGLGNAFSGEGVPSFVVAIIGLVMLFAGSGKKQRRQETREALRQARQLYREPILQAKQEVSKQVKEAVRMAENRTQQRAQQWQPQQQAANPQQKAPSCPNPEPHRHYEAPRQPQSNGARLIENRRTLYEAGLLTREEYDAEVRKLRGR